MFNQLIQWLFGSLFSSEENTDLRTLSYKSRLNMEKAVKAALRKKSPQHASRAAEHIANFIFNFGDYGFQLDTPKDVIQLVTSEIDQLASLQSVAPDTLCRVLVHRALELKANDLNFESHMRDLWSMGYLCIGPLTPAAEQFPTQPLRNMANRVRQMETISRHREQFETLWKNHPSYKRMTAPVSKPVDKKP